MSPVSSRMIRMSRPDTSSGFRLEAPTSCSWQIAGRKLANRPRFLRKPRMACSGRKARSSLSYFQSPTAPNSTASASFASFRVASGSGWPCASYAARPTSAVSVSNFRSRTSRTFIASATISVPMPSPGRTAIFIRCLSARERVCEPGLGGEALRLEGLDRVLVPQRQADVVEAVEQAVLAKRLHVERVFLCLRRDHHLALEVDRQFVARERVDLVEQACHLRLGQHDRQQAVLEAVGEEDVRVAGRDDGAEAVLVERPRRVLARRPAAEVLACQQDRRT